MLQLINVCKDYQVDKKPFPALKNINIAFGDKGFVSILGPSGCGKTTLLNLIGGLDTYTSGDLLINAKSTIEFTDRGWDSYRNIYVGFVFQTYNLVPHLTVLGNVELSLTLSGMRKKERQERALKALESVGLKEVAKKRPNQLSGGQMQRVAIARSLVNDPSLILADEPTGALDSVTSIQVMDILAEVAKTHLVIMVTHNEELANKYSDRIIKLKDGEVIEDSNPFDVSKHILSQMKTDAKINQNNSADVKHTHMSFKTALGSSFKSLLTKKGRTILTSIAASFGIIGVALVLAMSNGFNNYIANVEISTASSVPITISPYVTTSIKEIINTDQSYPTEKVLKPYDQDLSSLVTIHRNNITKEYSDYCFKLLEEPQNYAASVLENHEYLDFNIFTERETSSGNKEIIKVDQFNGAGTGGSILSSVTGLPSTIFHELYGGKEYIESMYEVIEGTYPKDQLVKNDDGTYSGEVCLVCDRYNRIPTSTLYNLGLFSEKKLTEATTIDFSKLINHEYKTYSTKTIIGATGNEPIQKVITNNKFCEIEYFDIDGKKIPFPIPVFDPTKTKTITSYPDIAAKRDDGSYLYRDEINDLYTDDSTNKPIKLKITGIIRPKEECLVNLMPGSVCYTKSLKNYYINNLSELESYREVAKNNFYIDTNMVDTTLMMDIAMGADAEKIKQDLENSNWFKFLTALFTSVVSGNSSALTSNFLNNKNLFHFYSLFTDVENPTQDSELVSSFNDYTRANYRLGSEFKTPEFTDYQEVEGYKVPTGYNPDSIDGLQDLVMYATGYSTITSVLVFPKTLADKPKVFEYLDAWNKDKADDKQILYSDLAGTITDAVGTMIQIISVVLICFSAISLLVSCVMTGIITYTSVLERTKEIGILRAIGARKVDVGRLFEAEAVIIGFVAGIVGCVFTLIAELPISFGINAAFPDQHIGMICNLHPLHALILIIISIVLMFVAGFIPARKAAKKDPVVALRSE